jgi:hypothetical protein
MRKSAEACVPAAAFDFAAGCRALAAGQNSSGECGLALQHVVQKFLPVRTLGARGPAACGGSYTLIHDRQGVETLACGEQDGSGRGDSRRAQLTIIPALSAVRIRALASGLSHSLAITESGELLAWVRIVFHVGLESAIFISLPKLGKAWPRRRRRRPWGVGGWGEAHVSRA